ncbi:MAG: hypothetical protein NTX28_04070 [Novosphingobium sp.]|nr:hypothetical protein [Novosphingobium sp.]
MNTTSAFKPIEQADVDFLGRAPIPAKPCYDPEWYELERQAVFMRSWIEIGHVCELPQPGSFIRRALERFVASRALTGTAARAARRGQSTAAERADFHNALAPRLDEALSHLDGAGLDRLDRAGGNLLNLCLMMAHVALAIETLGEDEPRHAPHRDAMRITHSPADQFQQPKAAA